MNASIQASTLASTLVLGIRVGVPHLTEFDVGGVRRWRGFDIGGCVNA